MSAGGTASPPATARRPAVATRGLQKRYGDVRALAGVDVAVPAGSVYGLVGPNGSGKTTLLSIVAGLRLPTAGEVALGVARERIAVVPDTPHFEPWLTAREVVDLARHLAAPQLGAEAVDRALQRTGLADVADRRSGGFSRGMLQRLGLAAAIVAEPELLILDEPASALDPAGRRDVLDLVAGLRGHATVVFSSHILGDVQEVCDTVGILRRGELLFEGSLDELLVGAAAPSYVVRLRSGPGPVLAALRRLAWVEAAEPVDDERVRVTARSAAEAETRLAGALDRAGARVVSVVPEGADLERIFLELTR